MQYLGRYLIIALNGIVLTVCVYVSLSLFPFVFLPKRARSSYHYVNSDHALAHFRLDGNTLRDTYRPDTLLAGGGGRLATI